MAAPRLTAPSNEKASPGREPARPITTEAQKSAIEARGVSICVAAGAGSGKTFVLVERFLGLVREGKDPREILTITFTEKAAQEMRERIAKSLKGRARDALESAWISTIHGFCARLLRSYAVEAGVDPAFTVLNELAAARERRASFADAQASFRHERPEAYDALTDSVRWGKDEDGIAQVAQRVFKLHETLRAAGERPRPWSGSAETGELDLRALAPVFEPARSAMAAYDRAIAGNARATAVARERHAFASERFRELERDLASHGKSLPFVETHRKIRSLLRSLGASGQFRDERQALASALSEFAGALCEGPARAIGAALDDLVARLDKAYAARKARLSALDFSDLEERARDLLERRADVREDVRRRFAAVLVDEFQDTSRLQQKIVDLVRTPGAFFAVGDVKQAIYGFRHASVRGLLDAEDEIRKQGGLVVPLDKSFRTRPQILAYVDAVFRHAFGEPGSEVPHQSLGSVPDVAFAKKNEPSVEVLLAQAPTLGQGRRDEARAIAGRIAAIVEQKLVHGTNPLRPESFGKPLRYRDCAILFRAMTELPSYEQALRERGVPYRVARGGAFFEASEIVDAVSLLKAVACPRDDLALAAVLRSPLVGLSDDALLALARPDPALETPRERRRRTEGKLALALERLSRDGKDLAPAEKERALRFRETLSGLRKLRGRESAREILARGLERTGLGEGSLLRTGSARALANLAKLLALVEELETDPGLGLEDVALALEDLRAGGTREAEASLSGGDEDAVHLLSVHAAKGLEWPLVVVADLGRRENPQNDPVVWSAETGSVPLLRDPDDPEGALRPRSYDVLLARQKTREREESKRLLYVAMTRACDHLILAGSRTLKGVQGAWLTWALGPLDFRQDARASSWDSTLGAVANTIPGPDPRGVRTVLLGQDSPEDGIPFDASAHDREALQGPLGPDAGARTLLDPAARARIEAGQAPSFALDRAPEIADAREALDRVSRPLPESDQGASVYFVTEILAFEGCPRRYLYEHILGARGTGATPLSERPLALESPFGEEEDSEDEVEAARPEPVDDPRRLPRNALGQATHKVLELGPGCSRSRAKEAVIEALAEAFPGTPVEGGLVTGPGLKAAVDLVLEWAGRFERSPLGMRAARASWKRPEEAFLVQIPLAPEGQVAAGCRPGESVLLRGTADLVFKDERGLAIVDYKTNELTPLEVPSKVRSYELQLQLYTLALGAYLGEMPGEAWLSFLVADQSAMVSVSKPDLESARARLARFVVSRRRGEYETRVSPLCASCPFRSACPDGSRAVLGMH